MICFVLLVLYRFHCTDTYQVLYSGPTCFMISMYRDKHVSCHRIVSVRCPICYPYFRADIVSIISSILLTKNDELRIKSIDLLFECQETDGSDVFDAIGMLSQCMTFSSLETSTMC